MGGIVPHITLESIANNEPPKEEILVDRPEVDNRITRVTGRFCVEGTIPAPVSIEKVEATTPTRAGADSECRIADFGGMESGYTDRMLEVLRKSPVLRLTGNRTVTLKNIRPPAKTLSLSAEAVVENGVAQGSPSSPAAPPQKGVDVPAWFLDTDYNGLCFHVSQTFFPRTSAWDSLKKALKGEYEESVWDHLAGAISERFEAGEHRQIAVKVFDDRGNELMVVEKL